MPQKSFLGGLRAKPDPPSETPKKDKPYFVVYFAVVLPGRENLLYMDFDTGFTQLTDLLATRYMFSCDSEEYKYLSQLIETLKTGFKLEPCGPGWNTYLPPVIAKVTAASERLGKHGGDYGDLTYILSKILRAVKETGVEDYNSPLLGWRTGKPV